MSKLFISILVIVLGLVTLGTAALFSVPRTTRTVLEASESATTDAGIAVEAQTSPATDVAVNPTDFAFDAVNIVLPAPNHASGEGEGEEEVSSTSN